MVHRVASSAVDDGTVGDILTVMDHDGPEVDEAEEEDICHLLKRENEGENVIRKALGPTVNGVKGVGGKGARHNPLVMGLVQFLVHKRIVEAPMDPVDAEIGESDKEWELQNAIVRERLFIE